MVQSNIVIDVIRLLSGVRLLEHNSLQELLEPLSLSPTIYYRWKDMIVDTAIWVVFIDKSLSMVNFPELPPTLNREMFNIRKMYRRKDRVTKQLVDCGGLTRQRYIPAELVPPMLSDYYADHSWVVYQLPTDSEIKHFNLLMVEIEKELPWLHEHNILMQTL